MSDGCSAPFAGVGSLEGGLLLARRALRRGGGSRAAWRDGALFFLLGGGEVANAAMMNATSLRRVSLEVSAARLFHSYPSQSGRARVTLNSHARRRVRERQQRQQQRWRAYLSLKVTSPTEQDYFSLTPSLSLVSIRIIQPQPSDPKS
jgi:hypothetical protein